MIENFVFLLDALVLIFLIVVYLELKSKRNAYVGFDSNKDGQYLNYWAVDRIADNVQIQKAMDYVSRNGGGITHLSGGKYFPTSTIQLKSHVTLQGEDSHSSKLKGKCGR